jgi:class 3 adenylate cyclase/tetratricopeptide (TPR) repeat protein
MFFITVELRVILQLREKPMTLHTYIPQDRLRALANKTSLPDRTAGSALFADISGFTALTESLHESLGARHGAEELSKQLGAVYSALIAEVEKYGGSVIGFAGDAMMCWFDERINLENSMNREFSNSQNFSASHVVSCAIGMQLAIQAFPELGLKVAITSGDARRFVVGDPEIQKLDALAGVTVARASTAEHHAVKGDVLLDEVTANMLGDSIVIKEWRVDGESKEKFAVVEKLSVISEQLAVHDDTDDRSLITPEQLRPWIHSSVYDREQTGGSAFLTEFRPCVALFARFTGIDYDADSAESELDAFICQVQKIAGGHDGTLINMTIGDKGSYVYVNFGALSAHEDDARRAVKTALELIKTSKLSLQIGISQGLMRVGEYGGATRRAYDAIGDDVNLAARLMTTATTGEILLSEHVHKAVRDNFTFEPRSPLAMKGKAEPLPVFAVTGESQKRAIRLQEPTYALPMVGRQSELKLIEEKLDLAGEGKSQVVAIVAEAGLGKSRLVAEVIRSARRKGFVGYGGACQSDSIHTSYQAWKSIWGAFFEVDHDMSLKKQMRFIEGEIEDRAPSRVDAMPLLNVVLDLNIPENDFTKNLEPKIRQSALHALLEDCLKAAATDEPLLIVIEDLHWVDALSHDLLEGLAKALANHRVCFVLAYRPPSAVGVERLQAPRLEALAQFTKIELRELTQTETTLAIRAKLAQLYPARGGALPSGLVQTLMARAQGNPFYLEELLNYVRDRGLDPADLNRIELPDSLHTLILSRIDQLSEREKTTLRVASIIGRLFRVEWLTGYYPELGGMNRVQSDLGQLAELDITPLDTPEPELAFLFKHIVTHEVTYQSLPFATRARLHEQLARYLENQIDAGATLASPSLDTIAFHYVRSENKEKQREYLRKAGEAAQKSFANDAALEYYGKILPLLRDRKEQTEIHLQRGRVLELMGKWDEAESDYRAALDSAKDDMALKASAQFALGKLYGQRGEYEPALDWLAQARDMHTALEDTAGLAQVFIELGMVLYRKGEYAHAHEPLNEGLTLAREAGDKLDTALALNNLGNVVAAQEDHIVARALYEESLRLRREMGDKAGIASSLNNLAAEANYQGDYAAARPLLEECLALDREMGNKWGVSINHENLGIVAMGQGDYSAAQALFEGSLAFSRETGNKWGMAILLNHLGDVALAQGNTIAARTLLEESLALCAEMDDKSNMTRALLGLGMVDLVQNKPEAREHILHSLRLRQERGEQRRQTSSLIGMAGLALHGGNPQFAAQVLGAVESAVKALNSVVEVDVMHFHAQTLAAVKAQLGESAFQSAWEEGSQWSLEEAVKRALGNDEG